MTIQCIKRHIKYGWPKSRKSLSSDLQPYWNIRDSLHEADDLVFYGEKLVVPTKLQQSMLSLLHESHMGAEKSKARARQILFWPGMSSDIERTVNECPVCHTFKPNNQKETLMPHAVPHRPWQKVAADIMTLEKDYLVVVDYYSKYPEIALLNGKTASKIITQMKSIFARHGIPEELICDNMPFNSTEFSDFASKWGIKVTTSSPTYPQSNGQAERAVQTVKRILKKSTLDGTDPYIALLEYRNTPVSGIQYSPAQMLMSRNLRGKLPTTSHLLDPCVVNPRDQLIKMKQRQKSHYDRNAKDLSPLKPGDSVRVKRGHHWEPATVIQKHHNTRSYIVAANGSQLRRNRRHLMHTPHIPPPSPTNDWFAETCTQGHKHQESQPTEQPVQVPRRERKLPPKLKDYVLS